jgi:hypothetical protein
MTICSGGHTDPDKQAQPSFDALAYLRSESIYEIDQVPNTSGQGTVKPQPLPVETAAQATRRHINAVRIELDQLCKNPPENHMQREEELTRLLFRLDDIDVCGDSENQAQRRKMIAEVQAVLKELQNLHRVNQSKTYAQVTKQGTPGNTKNMSQPQKSILRQNAVKKQRDASNSSYDDYPDSSTKANSNNLQVIPQTQKNQGHQEYKDNQVQVATSDSPYSDHSDSSSKLNSAFQSNPQCQQTQVLQESEEKPTEASDSSYFKYSSSNSTQSDMALDSDSSYEDILDETQSQVDIDITDSAYIASFDLNLLQEALPLQSNINTGIQLKANDGEAKNLVSDMEIVDEQLDGMETAKKLVTSGDCQMLPPVNATGEIAACPTPDSPETTETQECDPLGLDTPGTSTEQEEGPVQLLVQDHQGKFSLNQEALSHVLAGVQHRQLAIISIAGAFRRGKSFLLNFLLRYLKEGVSFCQ